MASEAKGDRKKILGKVRSGRLTPHAAEELARERGQAPFARRPDTSGLDPMQEDHWTLSMAAAWFIWRSPVAVKDQWNRAREGWTRWHRVGHRSGWSLKSFGRASLADVFSQAGFYRVVEGSNRPSDNPRCRLRDALVSGKLTAVRIWPDGQEDVEVANKDWPRLFEILARPRSKLPPLSGGLVSQKRADRSPVLRADNSSGCDVPRADTAATMLAGGASEQGSTCAEASPDTSEEMLAALDLPFIEDDADSETCRVITEDEFEYVFSREQVISAERAITRREFERPVWGIDQVVGWVAYKDEAKFRSLSKQDFDYPVYYDRVYEPDFEKDGLLKTIFEVLTSQKSKLFGYRTGISGNTRILPEDWLSFDIDDIWLQEDIMFISKDVRKAFKPPMPRAEEGRKVSTAEVKRMILEARRKNGGNISQQEAFQLLKPKGVTWRQVCEISRAIDLEQVGGTKRGPKGPRKKRDVSV